MERLCRMKKYSPSWEYKDWVDRVVSRVTEAPSVWS